VINNRAQAIMPACGDHSYNARVTFKLLPGFDKYELFEISERVSSQTAASLSTIDVSLIPSHIIPKSNLHKGHSGPFNTALSITRYQKGLGLNSSRCHLAKTVKEYYDLGGSEADLRFELDQRFISLNDGCINSKELVNGVCGSSRLQSTVFSAETILSNDVWMATKSHLQVAEQAHFLWDVACVSAYEIIGKHHKALLSDSGPIDHLYGSDHDLVGDELADFIGIMCCNRFQDVDVCLAVIGADDLDFKEELIKELRDMSPENKVAYIKSIIKELSGLCRNGCFSLEVLPPDRKAIKTKLVLKIKRLADGSYYSHKARLVIQGFLERIGIDYWSTYCPMASLDSARSLMAIAVKHGLPIFHADIPQAFIQAVLAEDIYCNLPSGIEIKSELLEHVQKHHPGSKLALKLLKSLYGLKQDFQTWPGGFGVN